jgi:hypothetical protein
MTEAIPSVVLRTQRGLEELYRVETQLDVTDFLVDEAGRAEAGPARAPREQLLIRQDGADELGIGLFLDQAVMENLERNDPAQDLGAHNFSDFCLLVEGVSHFVYFTLRARADRPVSALELELQAEVDKFACCVLLSANRPGGPEGAAARGRTGAAGWARGLFEDVRFADDLDPEELDRYRTANRDARRYAAALSRQFIDSDRLADMLPELRHFYRMPLAQKRAHIARADG